MYLLLRRLNTIHQCLANIRPPCPSDIPPNRGELKGGQTDEHTNFATFLLAVIIISAVFCFLAISEVCYAESTCVPVEEYQQASGLILEGRYSEAEKIFDDFIAKHPDEPAGALLKAAVLHYRSIDYDDFSLDGEYLGLLETAEKLARKKIDNDENDLWAHYYYYSAVSLKAVWAVTNGKFISGLAKGRSGFHGMSGIISTDERFFDAYLMTGSYRFWKSITIDWLPFVSDEREQGIAEVESAISAGKLCGPLSNTVLMEMLIKHDLERAVALGETMTDRYPSCRLFSWQLGEAYKRSERFEDAVRVLTGVAASMTNDPFDDGSGPLRCWWKLAVLSKAMGKTKACSLYCKKIAEAGKKETVFERQRKRIEGARRMFEDIKDE